MREEGRLGRFDHDDGHDSAWHSALASSGAHPHSVIAARDMMYGLWFAMAFHGNCMMKIAEEVGVRMSVCHILERWPQLVKD